MMGATRALRDPATISRALWCGLLLASALVACSEPTAPDDEAESTTADTAQGDVTPVDVTDAASTPPTPDVRLDDAGADSEPDAPSDAVAEVEPDTATDAATELRDTDLACQGEACACAADRECASLLCLVSPDESRCATFCAPDAPCERSDDTCVAIAPRDGGESLGLCMPSPPLACTPCDADCSGAQLGCDTSGAAPQCRLRCPLLGCPAGTACEDRAGQALCVPLVDDCAACDDADGDGFGEGPGCLATDCNDADDAAFPGALERCNERDDDCDGAVDETFVLESDAAHCGACGRACALPDAVASCVEGTCAIAACTPGFADCDGQPDNGCEVALSETPCGSCSAIGGTAGAACGTCGTGSLVCAADGELRCEGDLGPAALNACGGCAALDGVPGVACGPCGLGVWECAGRELVGCVGETPADALNACGGCSSLDTQPGEPCGPCGASARICLGSDATVCDRSGNCPPFLEGVRVEPDAPTPRDRLRCRASSSVSDPDPDDALTLRVSWQLNGEEAPAARLDGDEVIATDVGEQWSCTLTVSDGDTAVSATAEPVTIADPCRNGRQDGDESDIDCGGTGVVAYSETIACPRCSTGAACTAASDCRGADSCIDERCVSVGCPGGFVRVPEGTFSMGSPAEEAFRDSNERQREITLSEPLCVGVTETTQTMWTATMGVPAALYVDCGPTCPVESTTWFDAVLYANARSDEDGLERCYDVAGCTASPGATCTDVGFDGVDCAGYRLPTEAEWEYAARAGDAGATPVGEVSSATCAPSALDAYAFGCGTTPAGPRPVAERAANGWGLYDVLGNVSEWTHDWYGSYDDDDDRDPEGPRTGFNRVHRGGSWSGAPTQLRYAYRGRTTPTTEVGAIGFRLVIRPSAD